MVAAAVEKVGAKGVGAEEAQALKPRSGSVRGGSAAVLGKPAWWRKEAQDQGCHEPMNHVVAPPCAGAALARAASPPLPAQSLRA